ncbi:MAG TPA: hypothetical protein VEF04_19985, partial [Blastocatellia bacterium]|nr:hypothetical protein [Blastocatellia bacterium]
MIPQHIQLFINKLENVKDEPDGGYKADCPVCALEDKGAGKLRVFPDGNLICYRFAGTGETRSHIEDIRKALGVEAAIKPSALVTRSLLDNKLKLECSPAGRGKVLVVARNCSSTLARDTFYLDRSADRNKFISSLSLSEEEQKPVAQALLDLCDEFENVRAAIESDSD